jgi:hypothetical protein
MPKPRYLVSLLPNMHFSLMLPFVVIVSLQSSVEVDLPPTVMTQAWVGTFSLAPPRASPSHFVVFVGFVVVVPEQLTDLTAPLTDIETEVGVNALSTAPQVSSNATHNPLLLGPGRPTA